MSGILSAIKLTEAGLTDFTVYEKADRLGGTWRENTYPGLACDVPSHLYSYSFALDPRLEPPVLARRRDPAYFERVAREHGVDERIRFGDEVDRCEFADGRWHLETAAGHQRRRRRRDRRDRRAAPPELSPTSRVSTPSRARASTARAGTTTCRVDGARVGDHRHRLDRGADRSARSSTGSSTSRCSSAPRSGSCRRRTRRTPTTRSAEFAERPERLRDAHDNLREMFGLFANAVIDAELGRDRRSSRTPCRANLEDNVHDPELRERLRPDYRAACKRLIISPNFYDAIQRPNAELVTEPIERIEPAGRAHEGRRAARARRARARDRLPRRRVHAPDGGRRPRRRHARRRLGRAPERVPVDLDPRLPELLHAERPERSGRQLLAHRGRRAPVRLHHAARRAAPRRRRAARSARRTRRWTSSRPPASRPRGNTIWVTGCRSWYLDDRGIPAMWPWSFARFREEMAAPEPEAFETR